jgi:dTDP-4-amino-4,6-dideoxygalactose transaminase
MNEAARAARAAPFALWPDFDEEQVAAVARVLRSGKINYWTGPEGAAFEREYAEYCGSRHAIALANGTVALELALLALGLEAGDEVVVTPRSFMASVSCAVVRGMTPRFADVDPDSQNLSVDKVREAITPRTRAIILVHLAGWPCDMDSFLQLGREKGIRIVEDCAQAHGAEYLGRPVGSMGDVGAFSFCQDKIMTTGGEGGLIVTNDAALWERAWSYKDHGKRFDKVRGNPTNRHEFRWVHDSFGTNWRMTEMQAALGRIQLRRLPGSRAARQRHAALLTEGFERIPALRVTTPPPSVSHAYYKYYAFVRPERLASGWSRDRIVSEVNARGVPCFVGSCSEIYREAAFDATVWRPDERLPVARSLGETSLMFMVHPTLTAQNMMDTCDAVAEVMASATR